MDIIDILNQIWPEWRVDALLGEGSFGSVYRLVREDIGITAYSAVKVISVPKDEAQLKALRREGLDEKNIRSYLYGIVADFIKEIKLMEEMKGNTNIVSVEDFKVLEKSDALGWDIFIRMEYLTSFLEYTSDKRLSELEVIKLGCDILNALELCAKQNIIHRDIKPENIFISRFGDYKLGDFGVARELEKTSGSMTRVGTYYFMAPEIIRNQRYDATVDIYSLGIMLYRILNNNRMPFVDPNANLISHQDKLIANEKRVKGAPMPEPVFGSAVLKRVILKACAYDPRQRYQSAFLFRRALEEIGLSPEEEEQDLPAQTEFLSKTVTTVPYNPRRKLLPSRKSFMWLGAVAAIVTFVIVFTLLTVNPPAPPQPKYTVTWRSYGGLVIKTETITRGSSATPPNPHARADYDFVGWDKPYDNITGDLTIEAVYTEKPVFSVTFKDYDGAVLKTEDVRRGDTAIPPIMPLRVGFTFDGWDASYRDIAGDSIITAQYKQNIYSVIFKGHDGEIIMEDNVTHGASAKAPEPPIHPNGYAFKEWDKSFSYVTDNLTVIARYAGEYYVTFHNYDETILKIEQVIHGDPATPPLDLSRPGYAFIGWDKPYDVITDDLDLTAQYTINAYHVTFADYDDRIIKVESVAYGKEATAPKPPERTGYIFMGWDKPYNNVKGNLTIKARYEKDKNYEHTVTFKSGSGTVLKTEIVPAGGQATAPTAPNRPGYAFIGWDKPYDNITEDITVTALYEAAADITNSFTDTKFRAMILSILNKKTWEKIYDKDVAGITELDIGSAEIKHLSGIRYFTGLTSLSCNDNQLTSLDLTENAALLTLDCSGNQLTKLNISNNTALTSLQCQNNQLTELDVSKNTALITIDCAGNKLTVLNLRSLRNLLTLYCYDNNMGQDPDIGVLGWKSRFKKAGTKTKDGGEGFIYYPQNP